MTLRSPQQEAAEKALLDILKRDPPKTRYLLQSQEIWMSGNKVRIIIAHVLPDNP